MSSAAFTLIALISFLLLERSIRKNNESDSTNDATLDAEQPNHILDAPLETLKRMGSFPWAVSAVMTVTLAVVPALTSSIVSIHVQPACLNYLMVDWRSKYPPIFTTKVVY
jgi:hypothetical protein